jgi:polyhydroxyalkanoate depolymerase
MMKIYQAYQGYADLSDPMRLLAGTAAPLLGCRWPGWPDSLMLRKLAAACEVFSCTQLTHQRPAFGISSVAENGCTVSVHEEVADQTPFCTLLRFRKETKAAQPRVLVIAPMSGHFSTLLRGTVSTLLRDHDVYITDWHNARDIALSDGRFGFDEYVAHLIRFIEKIGPGTHLLAVCQPTVAALAAVALRLPNSTRRSPPA